MHWIYSLKTTPFSVNKYMTTFRKSDNSGIKTRNHIFIRVFFPNSYRERERKSSILLKCHGGIVSFELLTAPLFFSMKPMFVHLSLECIPVSNNGSSLTTSTSTCTPFIPVEWFSTLDYGPEGSWTIFRDACILSRLHSCTTFGWFKFRWGPLGYSGFTGFL